MGNKQLSNQAYHQDKNMLEELCMLTRRDFNEPSCFSFDPFGLQQTLSKNVVVLKNLSISSQIDQNEDTQALVPTLETQVQLDSEKMEIQENVQKKESQFQISSLQKNQNLKNTISKTKIIKKEPKLKKMKIQENTPNKQDSEGCGDEGIRDQNNCKSYHKLVKKYLIQNNLQQKIKEYEDKYHTRYYFIIALLLIKYYLTKDFYPIYCQIVQDEVKFQTGKIVRKQQEIARLNSKIQQEKEKPQAISILNDKKAKLENQICHIGVVISEIENYSKKCCQAFFRNETKEALRILYMKSDPVMRKKYYFDTAVEIIQDLQDKMRHDVSHG